MSIYEQCEYCEGDRAKGAIELALQCGWCKGKGYHRKASSYTCNQCGEYLLPNGGFGTPNGLVETKVSGGHNSDALLDGVEYTFSLCEKCLRVLFDGFSVPPQVRDRINCSLDSDPYTYERDQEANANRIWRASGGPRKKFREGICNANEKCRSWATKRHFISGRLQDEAFCDEHARANTYGNSHWAPASELKAVVVGSPDRKSVDEKRLVADVWLRLTANPDPFLTYHEHLAGCVADLLDPSEDEDEESLGAIWIPAMGGPRDINFGELPRIVLPSGELYYGSKRVRDLTYIHYELFPRDRRD